MSVLAAVIMQPPVAGQPPWESNPPTSKCLELGTMCSGCLFRHVSDQLLICDAQIFGQSEVWSRRIMIKQIYLLHDINDVLA